MMGAERVTPRPLRGLFVIALLGLGALGTTGLAQEIVLHEDPFASSGGQSFTNCGDG